ncbi:MAG: hypothetical protein Q8O59_03660 [bacterium]|nr:hypothetical protein [bacterium]
MKFKYKNIGGALRPIIPVEISYQDRSVRYEVLVDSGADKNIFDAEIGEILNIDIEKGERGQVGGITGVLQTLYAHPVEINVGGYKYKTKVAFLRNMPAFGYGVVGQLGFFDFFIVKFDYLKESIELKERRNI